ncbi:MAG: DUF6361 family protein [Reyranellales bacterium]
MKKKRRIRRQADPRLGWLYLSRAALDAAREQLDSHEQGVRDELGFGAIHFGYADRFFPGTSVLLTRLRYAVFIPWLYQDLQRDFRSEVFPRDELAERERDLANALKNNYLDRGLDRRGIIGRFVVADRPPVVLPSQIYWPSLVSWKIVAPMEDGSRPSRSEVQADWDRFARPSAERLQSDDGQDVQPSQLLFDLPKLDQGRKEWSQRRGGSGKISFRLTKAEHHVLRDKLKALSRPKGDGLSLFARLADNFEKVNVDAKSPWSKPIRQFADVSDKEALRRAEQAALLVQFGRGIYDALLARSRAKDDKNFTCDAEASLETLLEDESSVRKACGLELTELAGDGVKIDGKLDHFLREIQGWCHKPGDVENLRDHFRVREMDQRPGRARLADDAIERRGNWNPPKGLPRALSYRWEVVASLLADLKGEDRP